LLALRVNCMQGQTLLMVGRTAERGAAAVIAEGRAKERRLIREHFQQVSDGEAEPDGAASSGSQGAAGSSEEEEAQVS
jgi:hypothetical protein